MKSIIVALAMFPSLSALAHPETKAFDLDSFNGDYESNRIECGARLEFSRNLLILDNSINKPGMECDKGPVLLFTCDQETGTCHNRDNDFHQLILLRSGDFIINMDSGGHARFSRFSP